MAVVNLLLVGEQKWREQNYTHIKLEVGYLSCLGVNKNIVGLNLLTKSITIVDF